MSNIARSESETSVASKDVAYVDEAALDSSKESDSVSVIAPVRDTTSWKYKISKVLWDSADKSPEERRFLLKLDVFFLSSMMLGYFIKTLDSANVNTAYINGMKEHLHMKGSDLNYAQSCWTAGYIVGQIPSNLLLARVSARYYLGSIEILWGILTVLTITVSTVQGLYAIRFFVGLCEATFFPGVQYLIGAWYSPDELTKRSTLLAQSGIAASMVTGYVQAGIYKSLQHKNLTPYKWLFVIDGIVSFPVALYTMFANPNTPETTTSWYLNETDKKIALERRKRIGAKLRQPYTRDSVKKMFTTWHVWLFPLIFLAYNNSCNVALQPAFADWLKSLGYSPVDYNVYPTAVNGAGIGFSIIIGWIADAYYGLNWPFVVLFFVCEIIGCAILAAWNVKTGAHWFAYFLTGIPTAWGQPLIFSWVNSLLRTDNEKRNVVVVITNNLAYITNAWIPIFTWSAADMPQYYIGFTYTAALSAFGLILTFAAAWLTYRDQQQLGKQKAWIF